MGGTSRYSNLVASAFPNSTIINKGYRGDRLYQFALDIVPDHGSVTLNKDGTFTYYPEKGYISDGPTPAKLLLT